MTAPGAWSVPINALANLQMIVPVGVSGRADLSISLVAEDGAVLAQAQAVLAIRLAPAQPPPRQGGTGRTSEGAARPATARAPILSPADRETAERFIARGERESEQGNVAMARQFYLRAAQMGVARAAMLAGRHLRPARAGAIWCAGCAAELGRSAEMV